MSKLYATLPLTCVLLGEKRLGHEATSYWSTKVSVSLYYFEEAFGFCEHLYDRLRSGLPIKYLDEVLAYERGCLELQQPRSETEAPSRQLIRFRHDPEILLSQLTNGKRPRAVPLLACTLSGSLDDAGNVQWNFVADKRKLPKTTAIVNNESH